MAEAEEEVLFDALDAEEGEPGAETEQKKTEEWTEKDALIANLKEQIQQMKQSAMEYNTNRVEAAANNALLQKQLDHQLSVVKHLKQMLKNISEKYTNTQIEMKTIKEKSRETQEALLAAEDQLREYSERIDTFKRAEDLWKATSDHVSKLEERHQQVSDECSKWKKTAQELQHVMAENSKLKETIAEIEQEQVIASKRTHHIIKELRQSLKAEQEKQLQAKPSVKCIYLGGSEDANAGSLIQELATRMEELLSQNAILNERIQFAQENVQLLAKDVERKRILIQQLTLKLITPKDEHEDVIAYAVASASALENTNVCESLLYTTLKENLLLKKKYGGHCPFAISWKEPECYSFYQVL